ncbi:MAG: hypothetical protein J7J97_00710 [Thermococcus sp.]|nr:hypothetical protein [Thermococcus sp.]
MGRPARIDKFRVAEEIVELASRNEELTIYNITKKLREISQKNNDPTLDVRSESVRRILKELVHLKILGEYSSDKAFRDNDRDKKPYKLLWDPEKAKEIVQCWKDFHSLRGKLNVLKRLGDSKEQEFKLSELPYKFCPYMVLLGIDWIEGIKGFLGKFDWGTFLNRAIPLYGAVFSLRHDKELRILREKYVGGDFFVVSGNNSCRFFEEARWVEYVACRKAKIEIENKLLEMFYGENDFQCLSVHYGEDAGTLSNYLLGVRYFIEDSRLVIFDFSPNPFLKRTDDSEVMKAFEILLEYLQEKYPEVGVVQVRTVSYAMEDFLNSLGFEERKKLYLYIKTENLPGGSRFVVELSKNPPSASERGWVVKIFEKESLSF